MRRAICKAMPKKTKEKDKSLNGNCVTVVTLEKMNAAVAVATISNFASASSSSVGSGGSYKNNGNTFTMPHALKTNGQTNGNTSATVNGYLHHHHHLHHVQPPSPSSSSSSLHLVGTTMLIN